MICAPAVCEHNPAHRYRFNNPEPSPRSRDRLRYHFVCGREVTLPATLSAKLQLKNANPAHGKLENTTVPRTAKRRASRSSCNTRPRVAFVPPAAQDLVQIPSTPIGIIDTAKFVLRADHAHPKDLEALRADHEWSEDRSKGSEKRALGYVVRKYGERILFHRKRDGCRICIRHGKIEVEVSLPRVLGFTNDQEGSLSEEDDLVAIASITTRLLPLTTLRAKASSPRSFWFLARLDLAVSFPGKSREFVEVIRHARRPRSSTESEVHNSNGLAFYGTDFALLIYDPGKRPPRGKLRSMLKGRLFKPSQEPRVRVEFRFQTQRALKRLGKHFRSGLKGFPFLETHPDKSARVVHYHLDHHRLHQILATEVSGLSGRLNSPCARRVKMTLKTLYFLSYINDHPELWAELEAGCGARTVRGYRSQALTVRIETKNLDMVKLAWNRPRPHPALRRLLLSRLESFKAK